MWLNIDCKGGNLMGRQLRKTLLIVVPYFLLYLICTISQSSFWGDLVSPIGTLLSAFIIFNAVSKSSGAKYQKIWFLFALAELSYAFADILWAIYDLYLNKNPENSLLIGALYLGTSVFIIIGITIYLIYRLRKWDTVQLVLDAVAMSVCVIWLLWVLAFDKQYVNIGLLAKYSTVNTISIIVDMMQMIGIMIW